MVQVSSLFLFGAGASAFSGECHPAPPPLGPKLFDALREQGGVATTVDAELATIFRRDFEEGMAEFRLKNEIETSAFLREMAAYFAAFSPGTNNLYRKLVAGLVRSPKPAIIATLNYDLLIEHSILMETGRVKYTLPPIPSSFCVLKLHGSCNFLPDLMGLGIESIRGIGFNWSADQSASILDAPVRAAGPREVLRFCRIEDSIAPALALYAKGKPVLYCAPTILQVQRDWKIAASTAHRIFLVGVRVVEEDTHVWEPLAASNAQLYYVDPNPEPFFEWARRNGRKQVYHLASRFEDSLPLILRRHSGTSAS